jgi:phosphate uptake regulator
MAINQVRRKIQKTGSATFSISMPKSWIVKNSIKSGEEVTLIEDHDGTIRISQSTINAKVIEAVVYISTNSSVEEIIRKFISYYLNMAEKITLKGIKNMPSYDLNLILQQIKKLIGIEVIDEDPDMVIFQDYFSPKNFAVENSIKRAYNISKLILLETINWLVKKENNLESLNLWEDEVDKIYFLIRRQLNFAFHFSARLTQLNISITDSQKFLLLIGLIEKIADNFCDLIYGKIENYNFNKKIYGRFQQYTDEIIELYEMSFTSIIKNDFGLANNAIIKIEKLQERITNDIIDQKSTNQVDNLQIYKVFYNFKSSLSLIENIAEIGLDSNNHI